MERKETKENEESFTCSRCEHTFTESESDNYRVGTGFGVVCEECFKSYKQCDDCEYYYLATEFMVDRNGNDICECCIENYCQCENCGDYCHETDITYLHDQPYCPRCAEEQEEEELSNCEREYSKTSKKFLSEPSVLSTILSKRIYSTEIETISAGNESIARCLHSNKIPKEVGFEYDGSLNNRGIEIITPMLSGIIGENLIKDVCNTIKNENFTVDTSCGMHIHLDVPETKQNKQNSSLKKRIADIKKSEKDNLWHNGREIDHAVSETIEGIKIAKVTPETVSELSSCVSCMPDGIKKLSEKGLFDRAKIAYEEYNKIKNALSEYNENCFSVWDTTIEKSNARYPENQLPTTIENFVIIEKTEKEIAEIIDKNCKTNNPFIEYLKRVMIFYLNYENVIFSFLPLSRRNNRYCIPLSHLYHLKEIENAQYIEDFEKMWYRDNNRLNIEERKKNKYDGTRYCGINFHSLLSNGHIEIRFHAGTIDSEKILQWIALHTAILDYCSGNNVRHTSTKTLDLKEKTSEMLDLLNIKEETKKYFLARQVKFLKDNEAKN